MVLFKRIKEFPNYWISMNGEVYSEKSDKILAPCQKRRYLMVSLNKKHLLIHRLVAEAFIENPHNYPWVDHIDKDPQNNDINNLRWVSPQMNGHNRKDNCEFINIQERTDKQGFNVQFTKIGHKVSKTFKNLNDAIIFRDLIQLYIDFDIKICPIWMRLYNNEMRGINKSGNGFNLIMNKTYHGCFKTLQETKDKRYEILKKQYNLI
jgi:hypothetical protein